jgi:poly(hydroxyalkanoate) granule-associated protein
VIVIEAACPMGARRRTPKEELMATRKTKARAKAGKTVVDNQLAQAVTQSAQKIWLAGLGAFARARTEGDKLFDLLVEQGKTIRAKSESAADQALKTVRSQADQTMSNAQGKWDKLEQVFEDRVSRSLNRLGVLTSKDVDELAKQVSELNDSVRALMGGAAPKRARKAPAKKARARKTVRKAAK